MGKDDKNKALAIILLALIVLGIVLAATDIAIILSKRSSSKASDPYVLPSEFEILEYEYSYGIPGVEYKIRLDYDSKELYVHTRNFCSAQDCPEREVEGRIMLTDDEIEKIKLITEDDSFNKEYLSSALESLTLEDRTFCNVGTDEFCEELEDLNGDGVVTHREYGDHFLDLILEEK